MRKKRHSQDRKQKWLWELTFHILALLVVLIWCGLMFDRLVANPWFSLILVLGILVIIYGGKLEATMRWLRIKIEQGGKQ